jgi:hypothetical protein
MTTARLLAAVFVVVLGTLRPAAAWDDQTGERDMPWLGRGGRARWFHDRSTCMMCPTGYRDAIRWGRSAWFGTDPYDTVQTAMRYLMKTRGYRTTWPKALGEGSVGGADEDIIDPRAAPYRFTVVMIEPTVVVMRFDLGALLKLGAPANGQELGTPWMNQAVEYGTHVPATGTLLWFSPDTQDGPVPVPLDATGRGTIRAQAVELGLERTGDAWVVTRRSAGG